MVLATVYAHPPHHATPKRAILVRSAAASRRAAPSPIGSDVSIGGGRGYTSRMVTISERLRQEDRDRLRRMTPEERLTESLALGDEAIDAYAAAHGVDREEARRRLEQAGQAGRRPSRVMRNLAS